jgi:hypothetical protein
LVFAISAVTQGILPQDEQRDYRVDRLLGNQGAGERLEGSASKATVMEVSTTTLLNGAKDSTVPRVFELNGCKYLIPRIWICAAIERATALAPLSEPLLDIIKVA